MAKTFKDRPISKELIRNLNKKLSRLEAIESGDLTRSVHRVHASKTAYKREKFTKQKYLTGAY